MPAASYVRVPAGLQAQVLREVRRARVRAYVLYFPVLLLFFGALGAGFLLWKAHAILWLSEPVFQERVSERTYYLVLGGGFVAAVAVVIIYLLAEDYRRFIEQHFYCVHCDAVDADDERLCPVCAAALSESAIFVYTSDSSDLKRLAKYGLSPCRHVGLIQVSPVDGAEPPERSP